MVSHEGRHVAPLVASDARVETLDTYEDMIHQYEAWNYTYIPMPRDGKYYNTTKGWIRDINTTQFVTQETHLVTVLEKLQNEPFLLIDVDHNKFVVVDRESGTSELVKSAREIEERMDTEDFKEYLDFRSFDFDSQDVDIYSTDQIAESNIELDQHQKKLITEYSDRFQIITLADVNTRRMKDMLYQRFADLAAGLGALIEDEYPQPDSILQNLNPATIGRWKKDQLQGLNLHIAEHMNLVDMLNVIQSSDSSFVKRCGFDSKNDVSVLSTINDVRNSVMHANRSLVHDRKAIEDVLTAMEEADRILENMSSL